jgi:hypothetical protein
MEPALWPVFRCRRFSKKVSSVQWLESAFYQRPRMTLADASASSNGRFAPQDVIREFCGESQTAKSL